MIKVFKAISLRLWIFLAVLSLVSGCQDAQHLKIAAKQYARTLVLEKLCLTKDFHKKEAPSWMHDQIKVDLAPFTTSGVTTAEIDQLWNEQMSKGNPWALMRVKIQNNKISLGTLPRVNWENHDELRISYIKGGLDALANRATLPDVDFLITLTDSLDGVAPNIPIFTFANNPNLSPQMVLMPDFEAFSGRNYMLFKEVHKGVEHYPWNKKTEKCIWRGLMTGGLFTVSNFLEFPRSKAISLSLANPDVLDAKYSSLWQCSDRDAVLEQFGSYFGNTMSIEEQIQYKYQLLIDGNSCAYSRALWQLFSNCLLFKQKSDAIQWYYRALVPFVHYVPLTEDMSNVVEMLNWAKTHDAEAEQISLRAKQFAKDNLSFDKIFQYFYLLLLEYSKLQR